MAELFREIAAAHPSQVSGSYIYSILPIAGEGLAALTSGDELLFLHKSSLRTLSRHHDDVPKLVSCMAGCEDAENVVICGGGDGVVALFDARTNQRISHFKIDRAVTALAHCRHDVAVGSEMAHAQATISIWDQRTGQMRWQSSENNEDITALQHHPSNDRLLLSGGDDGLVSIFDTSIQDENDSLVQAFDHGVLLNQHPSGPVYVSPRLPTLLPQAKKVVLGPIHKAGFLSDNAIYALSADEQLSIHPVLSSEPDGSDAVQPVSFGDLRPTAQCDYVIDVLRDPNQPYVVTGSHNSDSHVDFIPLVANPAFSLSQQNVLRLQGAHGDEIVRSVYLDRSVETIYTAGEDGCVKGFRAVISSPASPPQPDPAIKESKKAKSGRFKPY